MSKAYTREEIEALVEERAVSKITGLIGALWESGDLKTQKDVEWVFGQRLTERPHSTMPRQRLDEVLFPDKRQPASSSNPGRFLVATLAAQCGVVVCHSFSIYTELKDDRYVSLAPFCPDYFRGKLAEVEVLAKAAKYGIILVTLNENQIGLGLDKALDTFHRIGPVYNPNSGRQITVFIKSLTDPLVITPPEPK